MKFIINGKDYGEHNNDILINYDRTNNKTKLQFSHEKGKLVLDTGNADISIDIKISSPDDMRGLFKGSIGVCTGVLTSDITNGAKLRGHDDMMNHFSELYQLYFELTSMMKTHE